MRNLGVDVTEGVGGTGIVGILKNGNGPLVLVRADMDGLPLKEDNGLTYASTVTQEDIHGDVYPVMHACGHDVHITSMVGTARQLVAARDDWQGTVMFVGQPAEERIGGARAMLDDGLYERFGVPDYALAFHVAAGEPAGQINIPLELVASSADSVDITVYGVGAHGASPHKGHDPILLASQLVVALQTIVSREIDPQKAGVITVGSFHGGFKHNIIPDEVKLQLTVRSNDEAVRAELLEGIVRITEGVARTAGLPSELYPTVMVAESTPTTINSPELVEKLQQAIRTNMGEDVLYDRVREGMGAEDFAYFVQTDDKVPGAYFSVGGTSESMLAEAENGGPMIPSHHSPFFRIEPEPSITAGTEAMTVAVMTLLKK
jgi:hippurate hydrolase